jgi:hypothetical protein
MIVTAATVMTVRTDGGDRHDSDDRYGGDGPP